MEERLIKTHLIITDIHEEYKFDWCGKILDSKPLIENGKPIFIVVGNNGRMELNTTDMSRVEKCAKLVSRPKGRTAVTTDVVRILVKQEDESEFLVGTLTHNHVKTFAPMFDSVGWR